MSQGSKWSISTGFALVSQPIARSASPTPRAATGSSSSAPVVVSFLFRRCQSPNGSSLVGNIGPEKLTASSRPWPPRHADRLPRHWPTRHRHRLRQQERFGLGVWRGALYRLCCEQRRREGREGPHRRIRRSCCSGLDRSQWCLCHVNSSPATFCDSCLAPTTNLCTGHWTCSASEALSSVLVSLRGILWRSRRPSRSS